MTTQAARAIDFNHLDSYTAGDQDLIHEVLRLFKGQISQLIASMPAIDNAKTWRETAHGIKGAARGIGAWTAAEAAAEIEKVDFNNSQARLATLAKLSEAFAAVSAEIDSELAKAA